jgi:hypothetical protein
MPSQIQNSSIHSDAVHVCVTIDDHALHFRLYRLYIWLLEFIWLKLSDFPDMQKNIKRFSLQNWIIKIKFKSSS